MRTLSWSLGFALVLLAGPARADGPEIKVGKEGIDFLLDGKLVTRYHTEGFSKPIFYPVNAPGQVPVTRDWPMKKGQKGESTDHPHQQSAWFVHGDVIPEGVELKHKVRGVEGVDFWSINPGHGKIVVTKVGEPKIEKGHASVATRNEWRTADGQKILDEDRTLHLYDLGKARLLVLETDLHASVVPIVFGDTKEGAMGVRINDQITAGKNGKGTIQNAEGKKGEKEAWGRYSAWCDYSGPVNGKEVGLALLVDPRNPHPSAFHVRNYGLMAANPFGRSRAAFHDTKGKKDLVRLGKGEHLKLRYGMLLHEGDTQEGNVAEHYRRFVELRGKE